MITRKVFQLNSELFKVTGIQRVLIDIHEALKDEFDTKIVGTIPYDKIDKTLDIATEDYRQFKNPLMFRGSVVIIHERRYLPLMWLLTHLPGMDIKCVYVHHNELYGKKLLSLFPRNVVAISEAGIRNLTEYFRVPINHITKIHNCVREKSSLKEIKKHEFDPSNITILYPARINTVKQQVEIVRRLKGKLDYRIKILFAGIGPNYEELKALTTGDSQFQALGFRNDIPELIDECDFVMLYSQNEGLPISLIEGCQAATPLICNDVGGNLEIARPNENSVLLNNWDSLIEKLNQLTELSIDKYRKMSENSRQIFDQYFTVQQFRLKYNQLISSAK